MEHSCRLVLVSLTVFALSACFPGRFGSRNACYAAEPYTFGVVPQFEQRKLHAIWKPIIDELGKRTGLSFRLVSTLKIQDFEKEFVAGRFDFAYINPYHVVKAAKSVGYIPLVADSTPMRGILVVPRKSSITKLTELNGKLVAFPSPNALGAALLMRADLERLYHVTVKPLYVKTHSSVYLHVVQGLAVAGGGIEKTLWEQKQEIRDALRVIYTTRSMPSHPVAAHPRVPKEHREKVRQALLDMDKTPGGRELLSKVPAKQLIAVTMKDYSKLLDWGLDAYWDDFWREE
jgi:phosphonate transport system substrate-binding protein